MPGRRPYLLTLAVVACAPDLAGPVPDISSIGPPTPALVCGAVETSSRVTIRGSGFAPVTVGTVSGEPGVILPAVTFLADGGVIAVDIAPADVRWIDDGELEVTLPAQLTEGLYDVRVTNGDGSSDTLRGALGILSPPAVAEVTPEAICVAQFDAVGLEVRGAGFLFLDEGPAPTVAVGDRAYAARDPGDCAPIAVGGARLCDRFFFDVPQDDLPPGAHDVVVTNPEPAVCASAAASLEVAPPPEITGIAPLEICTGRAELTVTLTGTGFRPGATATIEGTWPAEATVVSDTEVVLELETGTIPGGTYTVTLQNPDGCVATTSITVLPGAYLFFVDPPVVWNGAITQVTLHATSITGSVLEVAIQPTGDPALRQSVPFDFDPSHPNRVLARIPAGLAPGGYDAMVRDQASCEGLIVNGLTVVDETSVVLTGIDPPFGWTGTSTAITVSAEAANGIQPTPRLYLSPTAGAPGMVATALHAVAFVSSGEATAVVPPGLIPGIYDLIAVNPDATVGVLVAGFTVTSDPTPRVLDVTPASIVAGDATSVEIIGENFADASVSLRCVSPVGAVMAPVSVPLIPPSTPTLLQATVPDTFQAGTFCIVRVTNGDGSWGDFSAVSFHGSSQNLGAWISSETTPGVASPLLFPRRALVALSGEATTASRFIYAIGGDDGSSASAKATIERATVDLLGRLGPWEVERHELPAPRTLAGGARIGQFLYLVGGNDGAAPSAEVLRARILDPLDVPSDFDVDLALGDGDLGLAGGTYVYRVSGVRDPGYASDPGGETIASEPITLTLPDLPELILVTLQWTAMPDVIGYRVYRGTTAGDEVLVGEVPGGASMSFTDDGLLAGTERPLPPGSLGTWHPVATLPSPREGPAVIAAPAPLDDTTWYLYAHGGSDGASVRADHDMIAVTIEPDGSQTVAPVVAGPALGSARRLHNLLRAGHRSAPVVPTTDEWIYVTGGLDAGTTKVVATWAARVNTTPPMLPTDPPLGALIDARQVIATPETSAGGAGGLLANGFIFLFGGGGSPTAGGTHAEICAGPGGGCAGGPPELRNFNSLGGGGMVSPRWLMGATTVAPFFYVIGGEGPSGPLSSTERTLW